MRCLDAPLPRVCTSHPALSESHGISLDATLLLPSILSVPKILPSHRPINFLLTKRATCLLSDIYSQSVKKIFHVTFLRCQNYRNKKGDGGLQGLGTEDVWVWWGASSQFLLVWNCSASKQKRATEKQVKRGVQKNTELKKPRCHSLQLLGALFWCGLSSSPLSTSPKICSMT